MLPGREIAVEPILKQRQLCCHKVGSGKSIRVFTQILLSTCITDLDTSVSFHPQTRRM